MTYLRATDIEFSYGPNTVLAGVSIAVGAGMRVGVTGPNGSGKSTLLGILAGELEPDSGKVDVQPPGVFVGLVAQEPARIDGETVFEHLGRRTGVLLAEADLERAAAGYAESPESASRYERALERWTAVGAADFQARVGTVLDRIGFSGLIDSGVEDLSGGEMARLELATVLLHRADILLLDEPTNNLDSDGLAALEELVLDPDRAIVLVSHDRSFLERTVTHVVEIDGHSRRSTSHAGGWESYQRERDSQLQRQVDRHVAYETERDRLEQRVRREAGWASKGVGAAKRSREPDKNIKALRIASAESRGTSAQRTKDRLERLESVDKPFEGWSLILDLGGAERGSTEAAVLQGVVARLGAFVLGPIDLRIRAGDRLSIGGPNGSGKTTLIRVLTGALEPDSGSCVVGPSVVFGLLGQDRDRYGSSRPLLDAFCQACGADPQAGRSALAKFGLGTEHVRRPGAELSPGERTRAVLAEFQLVGVNFLILDEPTNHLDIEAIEQLQTALGSFGGTLIVITHDQSFRNELDVGREVWLDQGRLVEYDVGPTRH